MSKEPDAFVLHDGLDEKKTEELHVFLAGAQIEEWDGHNDGINLWINVRIGDTILRHEDGSVRVVRKEDA